MRFTCRLFTVAVRLAMEASSEAGSKELPLPSPPAERGSAQDVLAKLQEKLGFNAATAAQFWRVESGTVPLRPALLSTCMTEMPSLPSDEGRFPTNKLLERCRYVSDGVLPKTSGMAPVSALLLRSRDRNVLRLANEVGIVPFKPI